MKNIFGIMLIAMLFCLQPNFAVAEDEDLDSLIKSLDIEAQTDMVSFKLNMSAEFDTPMPEVEALLKTVDKPSDAYMCLRVIHISKQPKEIILKQYRAHKAKGWGVIAGNLGIRPGSKEFHGMKNRDRHRHTGKGKGRGR